MKKIKRVLTLFTILFLSTFHCSLYSSDQWAETDATIINVEIIKNEKEDMIQYTFKYNSPESNAVDQKGEKILGPIEQMVSRPFNGKKPIENQKIRIQYLKDEPIIFKLIGEIKYEKKT